jgi:uncharacterized protein (TIGR02001 family)
MFRKAMIAGAITAALLASGAVFAADAPAPAGAAPAAEAKPAEETSPHTFTANVGVFNQYIFRGLTQTNARPAIQGGFDYAYNFGPASVYIGSWNSNISWLTDGGQYSSSGIESDLYGGVKGNFGATDFTWDVGFLQYFYPGNVAAGGAKGDTSEVYGALGWKWLTFKTSYVVSNKAFAVQDAQGTYYLDLSAAYPVGETGVTLIAHYGMQKYQGTDARNPGPASNRASNDTIYSYNDYKLGASYDLGKLTKVLNAVTLGAYYNNTSSADSRGYGGRGDAPAGPYPKAISGSTGVVYLQKTF